MKLKKLESYLRVNLLGTGPPLIKKIPGRGLTKVRKHWTRRTIISKSAGCLCGGQYWKAGRIVQSGGMCLGSIRSMDPSFARVQIQMGCPSTHSVILCWIESCSQHREQELEFVRWVAANLSFVGTILWIAANHADSTVSGTVDAWRFYQMRPPVGSRGIFALSVVQGVVLNFFHAHQDIIYTSFEGLARFCRGIRGHVGHFHRVLSYVDEVRGDPGHKRLLHRSDNTTTWLNIWYTEINYW